MTLRRLACLVMLLTSASPATAARVAGRLLASDGEPVAGANIVVADSPGATPIAEGSTDAEGRFSVDVRSSSRGFGIIATVEGRPAIGFRTLVTDWPDGRAAPPDFVLPPPAALEGTVSDSSGRPVAGVVVRAQADTPWHACDAEATTCAAGRFALAGLPAWSTVTLRADTGSERGWAIRLASGRAAGVANLRLVASSERDDPYSFGPALTDTVMTRICATDWDQPARARVMGGSGKDAATVTWFSSMSAQGMTACDQEGIAAGSLGFVVAALARVPGEACMEWVRDRAFECELVPAAVIHVSGGRRGAVLLISVAMPAIVLRLDTPGVTRAEVPPGAWGVVEIGSGWPPIVVDAGPGDHRRVHLRSSRRATARVRVTDESGAPLPGASVGVDAYGEPGIIGSTRSVIETGGDGTAEILGCLRGARTVVRAFHPLRPSVVRDAVLRGTTAIVLPEPARIRGTVRDEQGLPLSGPRVRVRVLPAAARCPETCYVETVATTGLGGDFDVAPPEGPAVLEVDAPAHASHVEALELSAGAVIEREIVLQARVAPPGALAAPAATTAEAAPAVGVTAPRTVRGFVRDDASRPVAGVEVLGCGRERTRHDGSFSCFVDAGVTTLRVERWSDGLEVAEATAPESGHAIVAFRLRAVGAGDVVVTVTGVPIGAGTRVLLVRAGSREDHIFSEWDARGIVMRGVSELRATGVPAGAHDVYVADLAGGVYERATRIEVRARETAHASVAWVRH